MSALKNSCVKEITKYMASLSISDFSELIQIKHLYSVK